MIEVLVLMLLGMLCGYFISAKKKWLDYSNKLTNLAIYILLFLLGTGVGLNDKIIKNVGDIGGQALIITIGALLGSVLCSYIVYKIFFINHEK